MAPPTSPVPFIQVDEDTKQLRVCDEAREILSRMQGPVGVCAIAGLYRTGKSYILNQIAGQNSGFGISASVQACTKGIWLWGAPLQLPTAGVRAAGAPEHLVLLDTEGLQSICQSEGHDAKIFCLAILLSSFFVYNSEKAINNAAIDQLSLVAQLTHKIRVHTETGGQSDTGSQSDVDSLGEFFPRFLWLLRDAQLELNDEVGRPLSADEYLESCLRPQPGASAAVKELNQTRAAIVSLFKRRSCVTLRHPTLGTTLPAEALKKLPALEKLHPDFRSGVERLKALVFGQTRAKAVGSAPATGTMLLSLADAYTKAINQGALPTISTAWQSVLVIECQRALEEAAQLYRDGARALGATDPPPDAEQWRLGHEQLLRRSLAHFRARAVGGDSAAYEAKLLSQVDDEAQQQQRLLAAKADALCAKLSSELCARIEAHARAPTPAEGQSVALPKLLSEVLDAYMTRAPAAAGAPGLRELIGRALSVVQATLQAMEAEQAKSGRTLEAVQATLQATEAERAKSRAELEASSRALAQARAEAVGAAAARTETEAKLVQALHELAESKALASGAQAEAVAAQTKRVQLESNLAHASRELAEMKAQASGAQAEAAAAQAKRAQLESNLAGASRQLAETKAASTKALAARNGQAAAETQQLSAALEASRAALEEARTQAASAHKEVEDSRRALDLALKAKSAESESHAAQAAHKAQALLDTEAQLHAATAELEQLRTEKAAMEVKLAAAPQPEQPYMAQAARKRARADHSPAQLHSDLEDVPPPPPPADELAPREAEAAASGGGRRSSVEPKDMAVPVLQTRLREKLGKNAKLPKKKAELVALYLERVEGK